MAANKPAIRLTLEDGTDLADKVDPRNLELTLTEKRGGEADELALTLQNHDGRLASPEEGKIITLSLGWASGTDVRIGLVEKGRFRVDEVEESGPPDIITIRARSADLGGDYAKRRTKSWKDTTLGAVLADIAGRNNLTAKVHGDLAGKAIAAIEQHGKSDMAFVKDLGSRYDAVATWKDRNLIFMPVGSATTASGKIIPALALTRRSGWGWRFSRAAREDQDGAEAEWHDQDAGQRKTVTAGGTKRRRLKRVYASEAEAKQAAEASAAKGKRGWKFEYDLTFADPAIQPNQAISLTGWNARVDGQKWLVESIETTLRGTDGLSQRLSLESA